jgi:hypothetical protein
MPELAVGQANVVKANVVNRVDVIAVARELADKTETTP